VARPPARAASAILRPIMAMSRGAATAVVPLVLLLSTALTLVLGAGERLAARSLAGQLLVATPDMPDRRFAGVVIYMVRHDAMGAMGLTLNRPMGEVPVAELMSRLGLPRREMSTTVRLYAGGPVEGLRLFVLHTAGYVAQGTMPIDASVSLSTHPDVLAAIADGSGPRRALVLLGYAGWGPGQLEDEIKRGGWVTAPPDEALVFGDDHEKKWERAISRRRIEL
jgi:putative transcriptional regulator